MKHRTSFPPLTPEQRERKIEAQRAAYRPQPTLAVAPYDDWMVVYAEDVNRPHCFTADQPCRARNHRFHIPRIIYP
jgi:hypothetical protein